MSAAYYDNLIAGQAHAPRNPGGVLTARGRTDGRKKIDTPGCSNVSVVTSSQELGWQNISVSHVRSDTKDCPGLYADSLAKVLALDLLRHYSTLGHPSGEVSGGLPPRKLKRAIEYIGHNLAGELTLINIADATGINAYYFSHLFKKSTGLAPHQYVIRVRVEEAMRLLAETDLSMGEIAQRVGYTHSRFSALFRRHVGKTPTAHRLQRNNQSTVPS